MSGRQVGADWSFFKADLKMSDELDEQVAGYISPKPRSGRCESASRKLTPSSRPFGEIELAGRDEKNARPGRWSRSGGNSVKFLSRESAARPTEPTDFGEAG